MNNVLLIGRLTKDPKVRRVDEKMTVATFSLAIDRPVKKDGEKKTDFPRVTVFGRQAESCEKYLAKGMLVGIQGSIQTGSYTNKDGQTVYTTGVVANRVKFLEWKKQGEGQPQSDDGIPEGFAPITDDDIPF